MKSTAIQIDAGPKTTSKRNQNDYKSNKMNKIEKTFKIPPSSFRQNDRWRTPIASHCHTSHSPPTAPLIMLRTFGDQDVRVCFLLIIAKYARDFVHRRMWSSRRQHHVGEEKRGNSQPYSLSELWDKTKSF